MNGDHLTSRQLDCLLIGDTDNTATAHIATCETCAAEVATMRSSIAMLSDSLTGMSDHARLRRNLLAGMQGERLVTPARTWPRMISTFALAGSVAILAAVVPLSHLMHPPTPAAPVITQTHSVESDEALLNEIDQQLSTNVPEALAPLEDPTGTQPQSATNKKN